MILPQRKQVLLMVADLEYIHVIFKKLLFLKRKTYTMPLFMLWLMPLYYTHKEKAV